MTGKRDDQRYEISCPEPDFLSFSPRSMTIMLGMGDQEEGEEEEYKDEDEED